MSMILSPPPSPPSLCCHVQEELAQTEERLQSKRSQLEDLVVQVCDVCLSVSQSPFLSPCLPVRLLFVHVVLY